MILDKKGGPWLISTTHGDPDRNHPVVREDRNTKKVTYTRLYYYLTHFSRFVRPGAYRINCTGGSDKLNFAGFKNNDGTIVLNVINNAETSDCKIVWNNKSIRNELPAHSITVFNGKVNKRYCIRTTRRL